MHSYGGLVWPGRTHQICHHLATNPMLVTERVSGEADRRQRERESRRGEFAEREEMRAGERAGERALTARGERRGGESTDRAGRAD